LMVATEWACSWKSGSKHVKLTSTCGPLFWDEWCDDHKILFELKSWSVNLTVFSHSYSL
jgi:hypothetical protein